MEGCSGGRGQFINSMELFSLLNERRMGSGGQSSPRTNRGRCQQFEVRLVFPEMEGIKDVWALFSQYLLHKGVFCFGLSMRDLTMFISPGEEVHRDGEV